MTWFPDATTQALEIAHDALSRRARILDGQDPEVAQALRNLVVHLDHAAVGAAHPPRVDPGPKERVLAMLQTGHKTKRELAQGLYGSTSTTCLQRVAKNLESLRKAGLVRAGAPGRSPHGRNPPWSLT